MTRNNNLFLAALAVGAAIAGASNAAPAATLGGDDFRLGGALHGGGLYGGGSHREFEGHYDATPGRRWGYRHFNGRFGDAWGDHGPSRF